MRRFYIYTLLALLMPALAVTAGQVHPDTWETHSSAPTVVRLDVPPAGYSDWSLLVRVGDAQFAIPRVELRKLAVAHPEWRTK